MESAHAGDESAEIFATPHVDYIFQDEEFEGASFDCTSFVLKYQKAITLETLKSELGIFLEHVRQHLYDTINRDYKDFIHIAMKLEGVDMRLSLMKAPIQSLHTDVNALYDTLVASLNTIQSSISNKKSINDRKQFLQLSLECCRHIQSIESILRASLAGSSSGSSDGVLSRRAQLQSIVVKNNKPSTKSDEFLCSEIERAAHELMNAEQSVRSFQFETSETQGNGAPDERTEGLRRIQTELVDKLLAVKAKLVARMTERMSEILQSGISPPPSSGAPFNATPSIAAVSSSALFSHRSFLHLLRSFAVLSKGEMCENLIAERVLNPLLREYLSPSKVDGADGRGSFSGLRASLLALMQQVSARLGNAIAASESEFRVTGADAGVPVDMVLNGVFLPALTYLESHFDHMFSLAIANIFHHCYASVLQLKHDCAALAGADSSAVAGVLGRLDSSSAAAAFEAKWKLDLYLQLRSQEMCTRIDAYCSLAASQPCLADAFPAEDVPQSLSASDLKELRARHSYRLPITAAFAVDVDTCLHSKVFVPRLGPKLILLVVRLLLRLELFVGAALQVQTPSFSLEAVRNSQNGSSDAGRARVNERDLIYLVSDLGKFNEWLLTSFCESALLKIGQLSGHVASKDDHVRKCIAAQVGKLARTRDVVWAETCKLLLGECRELLLGVKAVASRFRMTNKPPPTAPSSYVENILKPIRDFMASHSSLIPEATEVWLPPIVVALSDMYLQQVQGLMETVRQMDTALQRRSKLRAAAPQQASGAASTAVMSDSDKITLQLLLDVHAFGQEVTYVFKIEELPPAFKFLLEELADADRFLPKRGVSDS